MSTQTYPVRYEDKFGRRIGTINVSARSDEFEGLHLLIKAAGDQAFGDEWARGVVMATRSRLIVENAVVVGSPTKGGQ